MAHVVNQISDADFVKPARSLGSSSIGQHLRHTLEFFTCLEHGLTAGVVNYDKRGHDRVIEQDRVLAREVIDRIRVFVTTPRHDQHLQLEVAYLADSEVPVTIATNYLRELTYNIEHAVHHMAIMKIGLREVAPYIHVPLDFGVAVSTLRHQQRVAS
ncbi:MAG: DinB family protein [Cyclobacteriaceae bacterium]|nr:DinB family protein [Cyclobacteriaceae bacterium]